MKRSVVKMDWKVYVLFTSVTYKFYIISVCLGSPVVSSGDYNQSYQSSGRDDQQQVHFNNHQTKNTTYKMDPQKAYRMDNGKMGPQLDYGTWRHYYEVQFPFNVNGVTLFYGQDTIRSNWFIQLLSPNGRMGDETDHGDWTFNYRVQFPFSAKGRTFFYGQDISDQKGYWFTQELLPTGKMGEEIDNDYWKQDYDVQFSFSIGERIFFMDKAA